MTYIQIVWYFNFCAYYRSIVWDFILSVNCILFQNLCILAVNPSLLFKQITYLYIGFVFWCFGQTNKQTDSKTCIALAFGAIASSSGDIQTLITQANRQNVTSHQSFSLLLSQDNFFSLNNFFSKDTFTHEIYFSHGITFSHR